MLLLSILLAGSAASTTAVAADETAKEAYEEGQKASKAGDYAHAAAAFARADALTPNDVALKAALDAAVKADDPVLGGDLLERAKTRTLVASAQASVAAAEAKLGHRSGTVRVFCNPACTATLDGKDAPVLGIFRTLLGQHVVVTHFDGGDVRSTIMVKPDELSQLHVSGPPPPTPTVALTPVITTPPPDETPTAPTPVVPPTEPTTSGSGSSKGVSPALFFVGLGVTGVFGIATIVLGLDTKSTYDDFASQGCARSSSQACRDLADDGSSTQLRTNIVGGITGAVGVATLIVGIFFTRWHKPPPVMISPQGLGLSLSGRF